MGHPVLFFYAVEVLNFEPDWGCTRIGVGERKEFRAVLFGSELKLRPPRQLTGGWGGGAAGEDCEMFQGCGGLCGRG